jgi:leucyl/phenylalanyl-tRNA--protein transferase
MISLDGTPAGQIFPSTHLATAKPNGLLAVGGDLSTTRLIQAYRQGIFPWYNAGEPILWWAPNPRCVLFPEDFHLSRSLKRHIKQGGATLSIDQDFTGVINHCAAPRNQQSETWILPEMQAAYTELHQQGIAHSIELWQKDQLVGGLYGVAIGRIFFGESMFSRMPNASKIVMYFLSQFFQQHGFPLLDCQIYNPHLQSLGAVEIPREEFLSILNNSINKQQAPEIWKMKPIDIDQLI